MVQMPHHDQAELKTGMQPKRAKFCVLKKQQLFESICFSKIYLWPSYCNWQRERKKKKSIKLWTFRVIAEESVHVFRNWKLSFKTLVRF